MRQPLLEDTLPVMYILRFIEIHIVIERLNSIDKLLTVINRITVSRTAAIENDGYTDQLFPESSRKVTVWLNTNCRIRQKKTVTLSNYSSTV